MSAPLSSKMPWDQMNPVLASTLNPIIANPISSLSIIKNVVLIAGVNTIPHKLGREMQGWFIVDISGGASNIYRSAPLNKLTLTLTSSAAVNVNLGVF